MSKKATYTPMREAFLIRRYHTMMHVSMTETVGHHTCNVIGILFHLYNDNPPIHVIRAALHHDVPEIATGDIPATAKWGSSELRSACDKMEAEMSESLHLTTLTDPAEISMLKFADMMDLCFKSVEEVASGNEPFYQVLTRGLYYILNQLDGPLKSSKEAHGLLARLLDNPFVEIHLEKINDDRKAGQTNVH